MSPLFQVPENRSGTKSTLRGVSKRARAPSRVFRGQAQGSGWECPAKLCDSKLYFVLFCSRSMREERKVMENGIVSALICGRHWGPLIRSGSTEPHYMILITVGLKKNNVHCLNTSNFIWRLSANMKTLLYFHPDVFCPNQWLRTARGLIYSCLPCFRSTCFGVQKTCAWSIFLYSYIYSLEMILRLGLQVARTPHWAGEHCQPRHMKVCWHQPQNTAIPALTCHRGRLGDFRWIVR